MAIAAVDTALWDLKARLLGVPLVVLLGRVHDSLPVYGSGGFTSYSIDRLQAQLAAWIDRGLTRVKMKIGRVLADDPVRVRKAREAIGDGAELFVDANGACTAREALTLADAIAADRVSWFEEPVSSDDIEGLTMVRARAPAGMDITAGEYGYDLYDFRRLLDARAAERTPVYFLMYDLLWLEGHSTVELVRYAERRELLDGLALAGDHWQTPPYFPGGGEFALDTARGQGLSGIVAKRLDSPYLPGRRSRLWLSIAA